MASKPAPSGRSHQSVDDDMQTATTTSEPSSHSTRLDRLIHERIRLGIISALAVNDSLTFSQLKKLLDATDGNLSVHARKLEEAGYIVCSKYFKGRLPRTEYRLASPGRRALKRYLDHMDAIIQATRRGCD